MKGFPKAGFTLTVVMVLSFLFARSVIQAGEAPPPDDKTEIKPLDEKNSLKFLGPTSSG